MKYFVFILCLFSNIILKASEESKREVRFEVILPKSKKNLETRFSVEKVDGIYKLYKKTGNAKSRFRDLKVKESRKLEMLAGTIVVKSIDKKVSFTCKKNGLVKLVPIKKQVQICKDNLEQNKEFEVLKTMLKAPFNK